MCFLKLSSNLTDEQNDVRHVLSDTDAGLRQTTCSDRHLTGFLSRVDEYA